MPDVPELSRGAADARNPEAAPEAPEGPQAPQVIQARTAILIMQTPEGETVLLADINAPVVVDKVASRDEAYGMCATALKDMAVEETAVHTANTTIAQIEAKQRQAMQHAQNEAIKHRLRQTGERV